MRLGINHIDKSDFLVAFQQARATAFKAETIQNSFKATGLAPYDPIQVLSQLHIQTKTPTPPGSSHCSDSSQWDCRTPQNVRQLQRQSTVIKGLLDRRSKSPQAPQITP